MKHLLLLSVALLSAELSWAQDVGRVLSATPVQQQVGVPRQVCSNEQVTVQQPKSGAGAMMGALAGGAMGNAVGQGGGRAAATVIGLMGGAILGDRIEGNSPSYNQNVQRCTTQTFYENRTVAYNVVYEFAGKQYSVQMPNDPGPTIRLQVTPVGANAPVSTPPVNQYSGAYAPAPAYAPVQSYVQEPEPGYYAPSAAVVVPQYYVAPRAYQPIGLNLNLGYRDGYRSHHRHYLPHGR